MTSTFASRYEALLGAGEIERDAGQQLVVDKLTALESALAPRARKSAPWGLVWAADVPPRASIFSAMWAAARRC
jgi:hypothetical protein